MYTMTSSGTAHAPEEVAPAIHSLKDLTIYEAWDSSRDAPKYATFYHITPDEEVWFGQTHKNKKNLRIDEFRTLLERVPDEEVYPEVPPDLDLKLTPEDLYVPVYIKRPGLNCLESMMGTGYAPRVLLNEVLVMEKISKTPHPNIIHYYGCRTRRGRVTCLVLEELEYTLSQYVDEPGFKDLDKDRFADGVESAVRYVNSLGLAHNDLNPDNIMIRKDDEGQVRPVLIDFGSCREFGKVLDSLGTPGWYEKPFFHSEKEHDDFGLAKLRTWLNDPE